MREGEESAAGAALLGWYDSAARALPWRVPPGAAQRPDPYAVWLSEVMLQQTTVAAVKGYYTRFLARWPTVQALAAAEDAGVMAEWAGLGYYARARNLLRCARAVAERGGFPETEAGLRDLPGIGPYTAAAVAAIAFSEAAVVVDGNVERVVARLWAVETPLPGARAELRALAARLTPRQRPGDHAQAMMDLGATLCTPRKPLCAFCPLGAFCAARREGLAEQLPRKVPKPVKPLRLGHAYVARRSDGALLLETRPEQGLLGAMQGFPGSDWAESLPPEAPPMAARWKPAGEVRHTFTHFHLRLTVHAAETPMRDLPRRGRFVAARDFAPANLPTVMRKVFDRAQSLWEPDA